MMVRETADGNFFLVDQQDHTELSGQFAAHWGNDKFERLRPYDSMVFGTLHHDDGYREWEYLPPVNSEKGRPAGLGEPLGIEGQLDCYVRNIDWVRNHDAYAGLVVSMHRTGLWQQRYETVTSSTRASGGARAASPEIVAITERLEAEQDANRAALANGDAKFEQELWTNYRILQLYDLLSIYFCCDGFAEGRLTEHSIGPVPTSYETKDDANFNITPVNDTTLKIEPFPFDVSPFTVTLRGREMAPMVGASDEEIRAAYHKAPRTMLEFTFVK
ncbi:MAG: Protein of unknown function (DUF3891) [Chloroflexi bacterium]|jgi:hypothetical protein|nr:MAG: Protein of unknown function (DUF3891) [Chloroflexota bacterium]